MQFVSYWIVLWKLSNSYLSDLYSLNSSILLAKKASKKRWIFQHFNHKIPLFCWQKKLPRSDGYSSISTTKSPYFAGKKASEKRWIFQHFNHKNPPILLTKIAFKKRRKYQQFYSKNLTLLLAKVASKKRWIFQQFLYLCFKISRHYPVSLRI